MNRYESITRRSALTLAASSVLVGVVQADLISAPLKSRIKQSAARWCFGGMTLDALCEAAKAMGLVGIDLLNEGEWETVKKHDLLCTMAYGIGAIPDGWNHLENHVRLVMEAERRIPLVAKAGLPNIITFSGNRRGLTDAEGLSNCVTGLKRIAKLAEDNQVTVCMELLNSKRDHHDYQCDHTAWGAEVCRRVGSERIKLLFDIYHMQIMEGDVCATIGENIAHIGHFHTGGVPGRHEIDESQELNYARVCRAIIAAGYKGFVAHEFLPSHDPITSLQQAVHICNV